MRSDFEQIITKYSYSKPSGLRGTEVVSRKDKVVFKHRFHTEQEALSYLHNREQHNTGNNIAFILDPDDATSVLEIR